MSYYHLGIALDGADQGVGLMLDYGGRLRPDRPAPPALAAAHEAFRRNGPIPDPKRSSGRFGNLSDGSYRFWFTEAGLDGIADQLERLLAEWAPLGVSLLARAATPDQDAVLGLACYADPFQYAFPDDRIEPSAPRAIRDFADFRLILKPFAIARIINAHRCPACGTFYHERPTPSRSGRKSVCPECAMREAMAAAGCSSDVQDEIVRIAWEARRTALA